MRILMVCLGNICRSPMAEGIMRSAIIRHKLDWEVDSAGTTSFHIGEPPHRLTQKICHKHNINISELKARQFVAEDFKNYDKIYAMAVDVLEQMKHIAGAQFDPEKIRLFLDESDLMGQQSVPDPWYGSEDTYAEVFTLIEQTCNAIVHKYK